MKVLVLNTMPFYPLHSGSQIRTWHLLKHITARKGAFAAPRDRGMTLQEYAVRTSRWPGGTFGST